MSGNSDTDSRTRRRFVQTLAVAGATGIVAGRGAAGGSTDTQGAADAGIDEKVQKLIARGDLEQAAKLLSRHDVEFAFNEKRPASGSNSGGSGAGGRVQPDWHYRQGTDCSIYTYLYNKSGDLYGTTGGISFYDTDDVGYSYGLPQYIPDGCGLMFDNAEWSAPNPSDEGVDYYDSADHKNINHHEFAPSRGVTAKLNHQGNIRESCTLSMTTELVKMDTGNDIPVQFAYEHTIALTPCDISIGISAGPVLSVSTPLQGQTKWRDEITTSDP